MSENKPPTDPIAEFLKLRVETAGMSDKLTNKFQLADSHRTSNIEVLKLHGIREKILKMREEVGEDQKKQEARADQVFEDLETICGELLDTRDKVGGNEKKRECQVNRLLAELEASRAENANSEKNSVALTNEVREIKEKLTHQEDANRLILAELRAIRKEMAEMKKKMPEPIVEDILGEWELVGEWTPWRMNKFRKFKRNDGRILEFCSDERVFSNPPISIEVSKKLNNQLINGDRSYRVDNNLRLCICYSGVLGAFYRKID